MFSDSSYMIFFFKQKTAYEMRISDWSSDVCSSDLPFYPERQAEIAQRRIARVMKVTAASNGAAKATQKLMIVIGEVKEIAPSRYGHKVVFKHQIGRASCRERVCQYV